MGLDNTKNANLPPMDTGYNFAWQMGIALMVNILSLALPIMMLQIYDRIIPHQSYSTLIMLVLGVVIALTMDAGLRLMRAYLAGYVAAAHEHEAASEAVTRLMRSDLVAYAQSSTGTHLQNLNALSRLREFYSGQALMALVDLPFVVLFLALIAYLGGWLVLVPLVLLVTFVMAAVMSGNTLKNALERRAFDEDRKSSFIVSVLTGIHTVKALAMESFLLRKFIERQKDVTKDSYDVAMASGVSTILSAAFGQLSLILTATFGCLFVLNDSLSLGGLSACTLLAGRTIQPVQRVLGAWLRMQDLAISREQAEKLFTIPVHLRMRNVVFEAEGRVSLQNLSFGYNSALPPLLDDISLEIEPGEVVAINGDKGSGKSTLLQLIAGVLAPLQGCVFLNGINPAHYSMSDLEAHVGYLPQHGMIFKGTLLENITGFRDEPEIIAAAKDAAKLLGLDQVVHGLPRGYQTVLNDSPADPVPPGIKQRIALTRILARKPSIVLFDDADRALDKDGYNLLFGLMGGMRGKCTMIIVSHDQNLLSLTDRFYYLRDGHLVPQPPSHAQHLVFLTQPSRDRGTQA